MAWPSSIALEMLSLRSRAYFLSVSSTDARGYEAPASRTLAGKNGGHLLDRWIGTPCDDDQNRDDRSCSHRPLVCQPANADAPECAGTLTSGSLQKFLKAQGREKKDLFFPPVRNYLGFTGTPSYPNDDSESSDPCPFPENFNFALVDYAGLAGNYLQKQGVDLGTQVRGRVWECTEPDGVTEVTVKLVTTRALGFAQSVRELCDSGFDFANTPTIFGNKAVDVADGALPAVGSAIFKASFIVEKPKKFPDLTEVDLDSSDGLQIPYFTKQDFHSLTFGKCYDGANHGKPCIMTVVQDASLEGDEFVFHTEQIDIIRLECDD